MRRSPSSRPSSRGSSSALAGLVLAAVLAACGPNPNSPGFSFSAPTPIPTTSASAAPPASAAPSASAAPPASAAPSASTSTSPAPTASPQPSSSPTAIEGDAKVVKTEACADAEGFQCVTLAVPRDHFTAGGPTWDVTYAIRKAAKERRGVFVTITGGPGSSGIASAADYTSAFEASVTDYNDIVFLDQRGVGKSEPIGCPDATAIYYQTDYDPTDPAQFDGSAKAAQTYAEACIAEAKVDKADLPFFSTRQAVEDLEAFRRYLRVDKIALYGESYGTQFVQTYATAHPDHVASLFVDGAVDLTLDGPTFYREQTRGFHDALTGTLAGCDALPACHRDAGKSTIAGYDALAAKLAVGPISFRFPTAKGTFETRQLTTALLEDAASGYVYSQFDRMLLQRAMAAATRGDLVPLARLAYDSLVIDPETLAAIPDPTYSDAMYYAVECQDYVYYPTAGDPTARFHALVADAKAAAVGSLRLGSIFFGDAPCLWWPNTPTKDTRVPALVDEPFPTFVLTATLDPATPIADALRIYARLTDGYLFVQSGGPHVIFGRGLACPDDAISAFLGAGTLPALRVTPCSGAVADPYVRDPLPAARDYTSGRQFVRSLEDTILNTDDYNYRFDTEPLTMGCDYGGTLTYRAGKGGTKIVLTKCAFTKGLATTGSGLIGDDGSFKLTIKVGSDQLRYVHGADGAITLSGTFRGKAA